MFFEKMFGLYLWGGEKLGFVEMLYLGMEY